MNYPKEYLEQIKAGEVAVSKKVRAVYEREVGWMENPPEDFPFYFDEKAGEHHIDFIERFCKHSKGKFIGSPVKLELFQKAKLQLVFGWKRKDTKRRRIKIVFDIRGRKCGKSTETAAVEWDVAVNDGEGGAEVYCTANKKDQANIVFSEVGNMRTQSAALSSISKKRQSDIYIPSTFSFIKALASDTSTMDGLNAHFFSLDESHAMKSSKLYDVMIQSQAAREQPLAWMISTNGFDREGFFDTQYEYASNVALWIEGFEDYEYLPLIYELNDPEKWNVPSCWEEANPGLGKIKSYATLAAHVEKAKRDQSFLPTLLTKDFNIRANSATAWLPYSHVDNPTVADIEYLRRSYAVGGCDLSATTDLTCATLLIRKPNDVNYYVLQKYFLPKAKLEAADSSDKPEAPYREWVKKGYISVSDGATVDFHAVTMWFVEMVKEYNIRPLWIGYDRALSGYWVEEMNAYGFEMDKIAQGPITWTYPMKLMQGAFAEHKVIYQNNPVLKTHLLNTAKKSLNSDGIESMQPVKAASRLRIDGTVSLLNAWTSYNNHEQDYLSYVR